MCLLSDEWYNVFLKATNQSLVFKNSVIRRSGESITKLFLVSISGFGQRCVCMILV